MRSYSTRGVGSSTYSFLDILYTFISILLNIMFSTDINSMITYLTLWACHQISFIQWLWRTILHVQTSSGILLSLIFLSYTRHFLPMILLYFFPLQLCFILPLIYFSIYSLALQHFLVVLFGSDVGSSSPLLSCLVNRTF